MCKEKKEAEWGETGYLHVEVQASHTHDGEVENVLVPVNRYNTWHMDKINAFPHTHDRESRECVGTLIKKIEQDVWTMWKS